MRRQTVPRQLLKSTSFRALLIGIPLLVGLYIMGRQHNPLFHSLVELFSAVVACGIFMLAWNSRSFIDNKSLLFIGIAYLPVGALDLIHELAYHTAYEFPVYEQNVPTQLWVSARLIQALSLFVAPFFVKRTFNAGLLLSIFTGGMGIVLLSIFYWENFPVCYVNDVGLTPFKKAAEYIVTAALLGAVVNFTRCRRHFDPLVIRQLLFSVILTILSELSFTINGRIDDVNFVLGHVLKALAFYFIYNAVIAVGLAKPYSLLVRNLKRSEESLHDTVKELEAARAELELRVRERTEELTDRTRTLQREVTEREKAEEALRDSETKYRIVADNTRDWAWWMDPDGRFLYVSPSCMQITGRDAQDFIDNKDLIYRITHPDDRRKLAEHVHEVDVNQTGGDLEFRIIRPDGDERFIAHACAPVFDGDGAFLGHRGSNRDITERRLAEDALRESEKTLRFLSAQLLTIQEKERKRVARELHDGINQTLSAIKFSLETKLEGMDGSKAPGGVSLERIVSLVHAGIEEARRIQMDLRPPMLDDLGIVATLRWFTREFSTVYTHIRVEMETALDERDVSDTMKVAAFRIVQEAMYNISRHSQANSVRVSLKRTNNKIDLLVEDNGIGFDIGKSRKGIGITSMRERAEMSLGSFQVRSVVGEGTSILVRWTVRD